MSACGLLTCESQYLEQLWGVIVIFEFIQPMTEEAIDKMQQQSSNILKKKPNSWIEKYMEQPKCYNELFSQKVQKQQSQ